MNSERTYSSNQLRDYASLFSRSAVQEWMKGNLSSINYKIERYDGGWLLNTTNKKRYIDYLKFVYSILENHYQNEYVIKNSFLNNWLIKELGETNSQVYSEFRIGKAIADLVMFNGQSRVFEIKTSLDSDKRLYAQIEQYQKVFNEIYLIVPLSKYHLYENHNNDIGIIIFDNSKREKFHVYRSATSNSKIDSATLMQVFNTNEYKQVVKKYYGHLPKMTSFNQFEICYTLIKNIPLKELNLLFIDQMKLRSCTKKLSDGHYKEFNQISLALKMKPDNWKQLFSILKSPLNA